MTRPASRIASIQPRIASSALTIASSMVSPLGHAARKVEELD